MPTAPATDLDVLLRYDRNGPRYTSYPTAVEFCESVDPDVYDRHLRRAAERTGEPLSLYVHLPFCRERCWYCGCSVVVDRRGGLTGRYLDALESEIDAVASRLGERRTVAQLHWGGGTPTHLDEAETTRLFEMLAARFDLAEDAEIAIEIDPRVTSRGHLETLKRLGFNRVSLGVQDFDPEVQEAIHRGQTADETVATFSACRELGFDSINVDLVYGLPLQTPERFDHTVDRLVELRPDRIALYSYAHVPAIRPSQRRIDETALPDARGKVSLFCRAREALRDAGYVAIGMDHFALPDDELAIAARDGRLHRNFMGYTVRAGSDLVGFGASAIGDVRGAFFQNERKLARYERGASERGLAIERGYVLDDDDHVRRDVIADLMCHGKVDGNAIGRRHGIEFETYFATELAEIRSPSGPIGDGLVAVAGDRVRVVGRGQLLVRNVAMTFDRHLRERAAERSDRPVFSRTI